MIDLHKTYNIIYYINKHHASGADASYRFRHAVP